MTVTLAFLCILGYVPTQAQAESIVTPDNASPVALEPISAPKIMSLDMKMWTPTHSGNYAATTDGLSKFVVNANRHNSWIAVAMTKKALSFIGTPYVWGGTSPRGFDCSGFVQYAFHKVGIRIPRTADVQFAVAKKIKGSPQRGDLVFFQTYAPGASHVGIYLDHGKFVQAAGHGVRVARLSDPYWKHRYIGVRRIVALH